jgi:uncharacterized tellurite resistance protein B-like protein
MFSRFNKEDRAPASQRAVVLHATVRQALPNADDVTVRIVASTAALLLCVAYADLDYTIDEEEVLCEMLSQVRGLSEADVTVIAHVLREHTVSIASAESTAYARELLDLTETDFRLKVLDVLVDVAAADDEICVNETNMLRSIAKALGLSQEEYNASQARHRDKLAVLK